MNGKTWPTEQLLVTDVAFEMLCLLMLNQNLLVVEFSVAIPAKEELRETGPLTKII